MFFRRKNKKINRIIDTVEVSETRQVRREVAAKVNESLKLVPSCYQHIGARDNQEDTFAISDFLDGQFVNKNGVLAVVADGMGGLDLGEEASRVAAGAFMEVYKNRNSEEAMPESLMRALTIANTAVFDLAFDGGTEKDLGTTLVAAAICDDQLYWISAGDSRIYLLRDRKLKQLTTDHIYANHLEKDVAKGKITSKEAKKHPERDYLTSYLGLSELKEVSQPDNPLIIKPGDDILLCSDGLTNTLTEAQIVSIMLNGCGDKAEELVKEVLGTNKVHQDNVTVVVISVLEV